MPAPVKGSIVKGHCDSCMQVVNAKLVRTAPVVRGVRRFLIGECQRKQHVTIRTSHLNITNRPDGIPFVWIPA